MFFEAFKKTIYGIYKHKRKTTGEGMFVDKDKM